MEKFFNFIANLMLLGIAAGLWVLVFAEGNTKYVGASVALISWVIRLALKEEVR